MSPEQLRGSSEVDTRSDIWSLGTILYELVTGVPAFAGATEHELESAILEGEPAPLTKLLARTPRELHETVAQCLRKAAAERPPDVASFAGALATLGSSSARRSAARIAKIHVTGAGAPDASDAEAPKPDAFAISQVPTGHASRSRGVRAAVTTAGASLVLVASVLWLGRAPHAPSPGPAAQPAPAAATAEPREPESARQVITDRVDPIVPATEATPQTIPVPPKRRPTGRPVVAPSPSVAPSATPSALHLDPGDLFDGRK
jgi:serine/threonine-protein kinase